MDAYSQNNFLIRHEYRDFFSDVQRNSERIGDKGEVSDEFKDRAFTNYKNHDFNSLATNQDSFVPPDEMYGTVNRPNLRNYNRMEYDMPERHDHKEHAEVKKDVDAKITLTVNDILNAFQKQGYTLNSTASAIGSKPITDKDYKDQIKL